MQSAHTRSIVDFISSKNLIEFTEIDQSLFIYQFPLAKTEFHTATWYEYFTAF